MDCPRCNAEMALREGAEFSLQRCAECGGVWLDVADLNRILIHHGLPVLDRMGGKANLEELAGTCPDCNVDLTVIEGSDKSGLFYESCESCGGIWLELDEELDDADIKGIEEGLVDYFRHYKG